MRANPLINLRGISLDPSVHSRMIDSEAALAHHLLKVAVAQGVPAIPSDAQQDDRWLVVAPLERIGSSLHGLDLEREIVGRAG